LQQNVFRLDVAMNDTAFVRVLQCVGDFARNAYGFINGSLRFAIQLRAQRLAFNKRHDVEQLTVRTATVEQR